MDSLLDKFPGWSGEVVFATLVCFALSLFIYRKESDIPMAPGGLFLLGHALAYQQDPAGFLERQEQTVGSVFRVNLAGRHMTVIGSDEHALKQLATLPESILSARQAVADIGFEYTLGRLNVYKGTDWHKRILKNEIYGDKLQQQVLPNVFQCLMRALDQETLAAAKDENEDVILIDDLFTFMRRCMLRAMLTYMISPSILQSDEQLLDDFMEYQDCVEDATAKAAVLPRFMALPLFLKPVEQKRKALVERLAVIMDAMWDNDKETAAGPWGKAFKDDFISASAAAELTVGLMFAAHKNPAIGVSQSFCYLETDATTEQQEAATHEARQLCNHYLNKTGATMTLEKAETLRHCVLETLRVTAHSIGAIRTAQTDLVLETDSGRTYSIYKGDVVCISHITMHRNEKVWGSNARDFRLDRWSEPADEYKYTTFSHGVHKCPGERMALAMMDFMLAILLVRGTKLGDKGNLPKVSFERATVAQRDGNVPITIRVPKREDSKKEK